MAQAPNGQRNPVTTFRTNVHECFAALTGGGAADMVVADSSTNGGGEIVSAVRTGTGAYTLTFRRNYPQLLFAPLFSFVDSSGVLGWDATTKAIDLTANPPTATILVGLNNTATDVATTTTVYIRWAVRTVSKN
jgi:hypothetical protein